MFLTVFSLQIISLSSSRPFLEDAFVFYNLQPHELCENPKLFKDTKSSGEGNLRWYLHAICQDWHQGTWISGVVCLQDLIERAPFRYFMQIN